MLHLPIFLESKVILLTRIISLHVTDCLHFHTSCPKVTALAAFSFVFHGHCCFELADCMIPLYGTAGHDSLLIVDPILSIFIIQEFSNILSPSPSWSSFPSSVDFALFYLTTVHSYQEGGASGPLFSWTSFL